jgi:hypothetical protein
MVQFKLECFRKFSSENLFLSISLALGLGYLLRLVLVSDNSFVHPDFYRYILQESLRHGLAFSWNDLIDSFQLRSPGEFRPRFLAYLLQAIDQKLRLYAYDYFLIPPTFSPLSWTLEILIGPYFLFRAVRNLTESTQAALAATAVYITTTGFLSGITMVLLQGKNLSNVILILCIYLASEISKIGRRERYLYESLGALKYLLLLTLFLGLFLDELPIFAFPLIPALFPQLFLGRVWRSVDYIKAILNAAFFAIPVVVFLGLILFVVPAITERYFGFRFDYLGNTLLIGENTRGAKSLLEGPYARFSIGLIFENAMTLFGVAAVPSFLSPFIKSPYGDYPGTQAANAVKWIFVIVTIVLTAILAVFGRLPARHYVRSMPVVFVGFYVFLTLLLVRHIPIATGYYYGAIHAVFFAVFVGLCYGALDTASPVLRATAAVIVLFLVIVGASNFSQVNRGWIFTHNETIVRGSFQSVVQLAEPRRLRRGELLDIWHAWKDGNLTHYLDMTPISTGAVYLVAELQALDRARGGPVPPRHVLVGKTGY